MLCHPTKIKQLPDFNDFRTLDLRSKEISGQATKIKKWYKDRMDSKRFKEAGIYRLTLQDCNSKCPYYDECRAENKSIFKKL
jgi:hypothetical protein